MVERKKKERSKEETQKARENFSKRLKPLLRFILSIKQIIDVNINIKLIPKPQPTKHDYAVLVRSNEIFEEIEDLEDIQPLISMFTEKLKQWFTINIANVKYDGLKYGCIYLDVEEKTKTKIMEA